MATYIPDGSMYMGALAFDVGSTTTRCGFAGDGEPRASFASTIVHGLPPQVARSEGGCASEGWATLDEGDAHLSDATLKNLQARPLYSASGVLDESVFASLLRHGLHKLRCESWAEHPLMLSEPTSATAAARRQTAEMVFEELGAPALCVVRAAELAAISAGRPTALVLEAGERETTSACVVDGVVAPRSLFISPLSGALTTQAFAKSIKATTGELLPACALRASGGGGGGGEGSAAGGDGSYVAYRRGELQRDMFETCGRCSEAPPAPPPEKASNARGPKASKQKSLEAQAAAAAAAAAAVAAAKNDVEAEYTLPDGRTITVSGKERSQVADHLVTGEGGGGRGGSKAQAAHAALGLPALAMRSINGLEPEMHKEAIRNVVVIGGLSCLAGLPERLEQELMRSASTSPVMSIAHQAHRLALLVGTTQDRRNGVWNGASMLGSMASHQEMWMSKAEYEEYGAPLISRKGMLAFGSGR
jgi:actin-related protein